MRCKYCGVDIDCKTKICPLCHEKLDQQDSTLPQIYPPKTAPTKKRKWSAIWIYTLICAIVFIPSLAINLIVTPNIHWFWIVFSLAIYGYIVVYNTILSSHSAGSKILIQATFGVAFIFVIYAVFKNLDPLISQKQWIFDLAVPLVIAISILTMFIMSLALSKRNTSLLLDCVFLSFTGYLPLIFQASKLVTNPILTYVCAVLCSLSIIICTIVGRKQLYTELKKRFHI